MRHAVIALVLVLAQTPAKPAFEVASIRRSTERQAGGSLRMEADGVFRAVNLDVRSLMLSAYRTVQQRLFVSQIVGAPEWVSTDRYDITARVGRALAARPQAELYSQLPALLQTLLEDRFKLKVHHETRELPVFVLTLAKSDGTLGPRLRRSSVDCSAASDRCGIRFRPPAHLSGTSVSVESLANLLSGSVERVVVDRTGLRGAYDIDLEWSPDPSAADTRSIAAAVQEQLGLKLEPSRAPIDALVIDHVERPTEN